MVCTCTWGHSFFKGRLDFDLQVTFIRYFHQSLMFSACFPLHLAAVQPMACRDIDLKPRCLPWPACAG